MGDQGHSAPAARTARALEDFLQRVKPVVSDFTPDLDAVAVELFEAFAAAGVDALLLKGPALAQMLYTPDEHRKYSDVDVLVAPHGVAPARQTLARLGYRAASQTFAIEDVGGVVHEEGWWGRGPGARHDLLVELHLRLAGSEAPPCATWDALAARRTTIELQGRRVPALNREGAALHLATHAAQHGPAYRKGCRELGLGLERWPFEVWEGAARLALEVEGCEAFAAGLRLVPTGRELARALGLAATDALDWEIRHGDLRPRGTFHVTALREAQSLRARATVIGRALLPPRRWITWQHPWAQAGGARLVAAYALHLMRAPAWAARAWRFSRRAQRRSD
jgi:hypothetical protein